MIGDDEIRAAVAYIASHVQGGFAPSVKWYEATCSSAGVRSLGYMRKHHGMTYVDMVLRAGAEPQGGLSRTMAARRHRTGWRDPHGRTWVGTPDGWYSPTLPVCSVREESFTGRTPDGDPVAVSRIYYSLR